ncbi:MAG TPA: long-chain fatty acid--CoA ligase [bacterium]|nr:long-chain fatty acid--CoA ligase [bacterium]HPN44536.1 long-chain fatty acid--CoA ligase [bacterium]
MTEALWLKNYEASVPKTLDIPDMNLFSLLTESVQKQPEKLALVYFGHKITYRHLNSLVTRFASGLKSLNVNKGDRVIIALPNIPQFIIAYWAVLQLGAINVLINPLLAERELEFQMRNCGAKVAILFDRIVPRIKKIIYELDLAHIIIAGIESYMPFFLNVALQIKKKFEMERDKTPFFVDTLLFRELLNKGILDQPQQDVKPTDPAVMIYTGGVTGSPKAVVLSHKNLIANTIQARVWITQFQDGEEVIMTVLPLIHSYGMTVCHHLSIYSQSTMILHPRFRVDKILSDLQRYKITIFPGVPTMYTALVNAARQTKINLSSIRVCISGGAPLPQPLKNEFEEITGGRLVEGYGLSEASPITHCNPIFGVNKKGSIGLPWPGTEARIVDLKTGEPLDVGETGEIEVRGPQVMLGYWQMPHETEQVLSREGWLKTGDIARVDKDGYFFIADRKKEIIFFGGENIYPGEVEKVLIEHPSVSEAAVIGIPDKYYGQCVKAFLVLKENHQATPEEIITFCRGKLAKYKTPRFIEFVDFLPKNFLGKVIKRNLAVT